MLTIGRAAREQHTTSDHADSNLTTYLQESVKKNQINEAGFNSELISVQNCSQVLLFQNDSHLLPI